MPSSRCHVLLVLVEMLMETVFAAFVLVLGLAGASFVIARGKAAEARVPVRVRAKH